MSNELSLPRMSDTMEEGLVVRWLKHAGDPVEEGEALVEIDTDKVTVVLDAPAAGFLGRIVVPEGGTAKVGETLAVVVDDVTAVVETSEERAPPSLTVESQQPPAAVPPPSVGVERTSTLRATPLARKLAKDAGIDLSGLAPGSGPEGRLLRTDVDRALRELAPIGAATVPSDLSKPSRLQAVVARRMTESKQQIPHYYVTAEVDVTDALCLQEQARSLEPPLAVSLTHLAVYACALALTEFGDVNSSWIDGTILRHEHANVGIAVTLGDGALVVPVLEQAETLSLREVVVGVDALVEKARGGRLTPADVSHGTFTVSNLGMFEIDEFHAIINPPESGILAVGAVGDRPVVRGGDIVARSILRLSLSADHRVYSGVAAARFLSAIRTRLENPRALCLQSL